MRLVEHKLSKDGVAAIVVMGNGCIGAKSANLLAKAPMLEELDFLFPRRNLAICPDVLGMGLKKCGLKNEWGAERDDLDTPEFLERFRIWAANDLWPAAKKVFEGRAFYVRSDAPKDAIGRGVYESDPFLNFLLSHYDDQEKALSFGNRVLTVVRSYFSSAAAEFRKRKLVVDKGIGIQLSQFIGRPGLLYYKGKEEPALAPFMCAVVKTSRFAGGGGGIIRFEYGMGSGAIKGRHVLLGSDGSTCTVAGKRKINGIDSSLEKSNGEIMLASQNRIVAEPDINTNHIGWFLRSAYPEIKLGAEKEAERLLWRLAENSPKFQEKNGNVPLYLELVSSSFKAEGSLRWFCVQDADYEPMSSLPEPQKDLTYVSSQDFSGHGQASGNRRLFAFGPHAFDYGEKCGFGKLERINGENKGHVVALPQTALSGMSLTELSNMSSKYLSNAAVVLEYEALDRKSCPRIAHEQGRASSEHFEQLALDLSVLFIPVKRVFETDNAQVPPFGFAEFSCNAIFACDKERGIAWGVVKEIKMV